MTFYEDGNIKLLEQYPDSVTNHMNEAIWRKLFFRSGKASYYHSQDTVMAWFEYGNKKLEHIEYKTGDTTYIRELKWYANRQQAKRSLEKDYPTVFKSEYDSSYEATGSRRDVIYHEEYFENGQIKYRYGRDCTYSWFPSGKVESISYEGGEITYDENHHITKRTYHWKTKGPTSWGDFDNTVYVDFSSNDKVLKIEYVRGEEGPDYISPDVRYNWKWNNAGQLIEAPKSWKEELPWKRFPELKVP
jgi:hypothetical protein